MPTTLEDAYVTITNRLQADWEAQAVAVVNPFPEMRYYGIEKGAVPTTYFARFKMQQVLERQRTYMNGEDKRYVSAGIIFVQVFAPRTPKVAAEKLRGLATVARGIFRGKTFDGCILFRNVRVVDLDPEEGYLRKNVVMEYEYDEIG